MREMAPIGGMAPIREMAPGCGKRSKKEIFNCCFAPPSERWRRVRSQRCKSKSECYRTGPTPGECCCLRFERDGVAPSPSCWPGPFDCKACLGYLRFLELSWSSFAASSSSMASPAAKGSAAESAAGAAVAAAVAAAATLPLVSEEVASAPAPSDMAQRMMCVS